MCKVNSILIMCFCFSFICFACVLQGANQQATDASQKQQPKHVSNVLTLILSHHLHLSFYLFTVFLVYIIYPQCLPVQNSLSFQQKQFSIKTSRIYIGILQGCLFHGIFGIPVYHVEKPCQFICPLTLYGHVTGFFKGNLWAFSKIP